MDLEFEMDDKWRVTPTIKDHVQKLDWKVSSHKNDDQTIPMIVESVQLATLRLVLELLNARNVAISSNLSKLVDGMPVEVKRSFTEDVMKDSMI